MLQEEIKDWTFEAYLLTEEITSWFLWIKLLKMTCARSYAWFLNFLDCFLWHILPKHSKITVNCPKSVEEKKIGSILTCPKLAEWILTLNCSKLAEWPVWKSVYFQSQRSQKHQIWTVGKPHWKDCIGVSASGGSAVISSYNHVTNLFISS